MGQKTTIKATQRQLRKVMGPIAVDLVQTVDVRTRSHAAILRRGFWGRWKWLLFGK